MKVLFVGFLCIATLAICESAPQKLPKLIEKLESGTGPCASSFAASSIVALEAALKRDLNISLDLSTQQIIDCSSNDGCNVESFDQVVDYIRKFGIMTADKYDSLKGNKCEKAKRKSALGNIQLKATSSVTIPADAKSIKNAIATYGVLPIAVDCTTWNKYHSGLWTVTGAVKSNNHAANLVGYGTDASNEFLIVRISQRE